MTGKQKNRMNWLLIWAGLLIVVLYSPIGSPELYTSRNYYAGNQNAEYKKGEILNSPKKNSASVTTSEEIDIPDLNLSGKSNYSVGNYPSSNISTQGTSGGSSLTRTYQNTNAVSGSISGGGSFITSGGSRSSAVTSGIISTNGIATLSATSNVNTDTPRQGSKTANPLTGGTDPGNDPTSDPIPTGDGCGLLILFGIVYTLFKSKCIYTPLHKMDSK